MNLFKKYFLKIIITITLLFTILSCVKTYSYVKVDNIIEKRRVVAITSFLFPKNMTDKNLDKLKYLNTEIYADYVLNSFISNFNKESEMIKIDKLQNIVGNKDFSSLQYHSLLDSPYVAASGTLAVDDTNPELINMLKGKVDAFMVVKVKMSFWAQKTYFDFDIIDLDTNSIWKDTMEGTSYYIIGDAGPTKKTSYEIVIADVMEYQKRHQQELYTIIDESVRDSIINTKKRVPYAFSTNDILFTVKTFSLTNENYSLKAGIK